MSIVKKSKLIFLAEIGNEDKCCPVSQEAYKATLMKFHPWIVQKAALAAMNLLPTREGLIQKICHGDEVSTTGIYSKIILHKMKELTTNIFR